MVLGVRGPFIVHNCTQAVARDCLAVALQRLDQAGYRTVFTVHDEAVMEMPEGQGSLDEAIEIMSEPMPWLPGLPLGAAGYEGTFYKKE